MNFQSDYHYQHQSSLPNVTFMNLLIDIVPKAALQFSVTSKLLVTFCKVPVLVPKYWLDYAFATDN